METFWTLWMPIGVAVLAAGLASKYSGKAAQVFLATLIVGFWIGFKVNWATLPPEVRAEREMKIAANQAEAEKQKLLNAERQARLTEAARVAAISARGTPEEIARKVFAPHEVRIDARGNRVHATVEWGDFLTAGWLRSGAHRDIIDFALQTFETHKHLQRIEVLVRAELVDVYGRKSRNQIMKTVFLRTTAEKIDLTNFDRENLPVVADEYWEHPAFNK